MLSFLAPFGVLISFDVLNSDVPLVITGEGSPSFSGCPVLEGFVCGFISTVAARAISGGGTFPFFLEGGVCMVPGPIFLGGSLINGTLDIGGGSRVITITELIGRGGVPFLVSSFSYLRGGCPGVILGVFKSNMRQRELLRVVRSGRLRECVCLRKRSRYLRRGVLASGVFMLISLCRNVPGTLVRTVYLKLPIISSGISNTISLVGSSVGNELFGIGSGSVFVSVLSRLLSSSSGEVDLKGRSSCLCGGLSMSFVCKL